jgi:hypothetical protein
VTKSEADRNLPVGDEVFLDHVGHFVRDPEAASAALRQAGFAPTPVSVQANPDGSPTGTGNVTAMLRRGYLEMLFKTADTPLGLEFAAAVEGHAGLHLVAFSVVDGEKAHKRVADAGFPMRPLVQFQRPVDTETGKGFAAFTVVRVERGAMAEGRIQMLQHRTEDTVWQKRWLDHPNGVTGFLDMVIASADPADAAARFARFTGRPSAPTKSGQAIALDRGQVQIVTADAFKILFPDVPIPRLPFIGAYALQVASLPRLESILRESGIAARKSGAALFVPFPDALGQGAWVFVEDAAALPWRA